MGFLALDVGSSYIKCAVLDTEGRKIHFRRKVESPSPISSRETRHEVRIEKIWKIIEGLLDEVLNQEKYLDGILLCTQMQGFVLTNGNGEAATPYISWQDRRCMEWCGGKIWLQEIDDIGCGRWMEHAGVKPRAGLGMCNLFVVLQEMQGSLDNLHFCTLGSYIIKKMTGNNISHITNGAATGLVDIVRQQWNRPLIEEIGAGALRFPKLALKLDICGYYERAGYRIPVYPDMGDHQTCVLGSLTRPGLDVNINIGTAGLLGIVVDGYGQIDGEVRPYYGNRYLNTVRGLCGGRDLSCVASFIKNTAEAVIGEKIGIERVWNVIARTPEEHRHGSLEIVPTFYQGGMISGINQSNFNLNSLINGIYKQIARQYRSALTTVLPMGSRVERIVYSGGAAVRNAGLMECIAREIGCEWKKSAMEDEALLGLYRMALVIGGACSTLEETAEVAAETALHF